MRVALLTPILDDAQMILWRKASGIGVDLHVIGSTEVLETEPWGRHSVPDWSPVHVIAADRRLGRWRFARWFFPQLTETLDSIQPDIVHVLMEPWGLAVGQVLGTKVSTVAHGAENRWQRGKAAAATLRGIQARRNLRRLDGYVSWNAAGIDAAKQFGLGESCPTLVAPAVLPDPRQFEAGRADRARLRDRYGFDGVAVGFLGRLSPEKGVEWLLNSFAQADIEDARLVIGGAGEQEHQLKESAMSLGVDARFMGAVNPSDVPGFMASLDVLVVPSVSHGHASEQFGRVAVEAMFSGTPVIASNCGDLPKVVGNGGIIVEEGDREGLAVELKRLVENSRERAGWSERGLDWVAKRYSPEVIAEQMVSFWERALAYAALK